MAQETVSKDREKYIGGSDIPIIMNLSPYKSRYDLLLEKAGYKENDFEGNIYTDYGNALEPKIRDYINSLRHDDKNPLYIEGKHTREATGDEPIGIRIHTDGERVLAEGVDILEIKTTSHLYDDIEDYKLYLVQLLFYMVVAGASWGTLAVYKRPDDMDEEFNPKSLYIYDIDIEDWDDLIGEIGQAVESFIEDLKRVKENPFITEEDLLPVEIPDIAKRVLAFEYQLSQLKEIEAKIKEDKARLKKAMESAGVKSWTTPNKYKITLVPDGENKIVTETVLDEEGLKAKHPKIYKSFLTERSKFINGKAGYVKITPPKKKEAR